MGRPEEPSAGTQGAALSFWKRIHGGAALAIAAGIVFVFMLVGVGRANSPRQALGELFSQSSAKNEADLSTKNKNDLNQLSPQMQAEALLELAIGNSEGANQEIAKRVESWSGKLHLDSQLASDTAAALTSSDLSVRESALEVQLAAYGLAKNSSTVDFLIQNAAASSHAQKTWALWALGALANRGVETERAEKAIASHLKDADADSRRWAVEGLALVGTTSTMVPLLRAMHDDPSPTVRQRAAFSLAESGMLRHEQRLGAVPQLVSFAQDSSLDSETHAWVFQALGDITRQRLPNDSAAWRNWYAKAKEE
jgi:hypothetical protein